jgi:hypothetical protein
MKLRYSNKQAKSDDGDDQPAALVCVAECEAPGYGFWRVGDRVTDPALIERFKDNPNFQIEGGK